MLFVCNFRLEKAQVELSPIMDLMIRSSSGRRVGTLIHPSICPYGAEHALSREPVSDPVIQ